MVNRCRKCGYVCLVIFRAGLGHLGLSLAFCLLRLSSTFFCSIHSTGSGTAVHKAIEVVMSAILVVV
jgi:hypothetical protein